MLLVFCHFRKWQNTKGAPVTSLARAADRQPPVSTTLHQNQVSVVPTAWPFRSIKGYFIEKGLSLCLSSHHNLLMMRAAHVYNIDTFLSLSLIHTLNHFFSPLLPPPPVFPLCLSWCLFGCWVLFVYCFQMADADFICVAFKFLARVLLPWLKRLSCFLQPGFMMGLYMQQLEKLSLQGCVRN